MSRKGGEKEGPRSIENVIEVISGEKYKRNPQSS
jgi:hypothetical protein